MTTMRTKLRVVMAAACLWCAGIALGDTLVLKDGSKVTGVVMKMGNRYWVEPDNGGKAHNVDAADVSDWIRTPAAAASGSSGGSGGSGTVGGAAGALPAISYKAAKAKADVATYPQEAIDIWKAFLAATPAPLDWDKRSAEKEIEGLNKLVESSAERVNGKWMGGDELKALIKRARVLYKEAYDLYESKQILQVTPKLQEAVKIYPNYYYAHNMLVMMLANAGKDSDAMAAAQTCLKLRPRGVDALNNVAILMLHKGQYEAGIAKLYEAVQIQDDGVLLWNLSKALAATPNKNTVVATKASEACKLLLNTYHLPQHTSQEWATVNYRFHPPVASTSDGMLVSGSGFVLNADGYVLTNRHVVDKRTVFVVITADNVKMSAELVKADTERDLALLKIKAIDPAAKLTPVTISNSNYPDIGAQCYAVGYPLPDILEMTLKVTQGIVSGKANAEKGVDILTDAKVNPGNSGGPLLDKFGQVIGIVTMKTLSDTEEDSYGMAISGGTLKSFLSENKVKVASESGGAALASEEVVKKVRAGTVCILAH